MCHIYLLSSCMLIHLDLLQVPGILWMKVTGNLRILAVRVAVKLMLLKMVSYKVRMAMLLYLQVFLYLSIWSGILRMAESL